MKANISTSDLKEIKSFANPPVYVFIVTSAAYILLVQDKVPTWVECKKMLANPAQLNKMLDEYDTSKVTPSMKNKIKKFVEKPNFNKDEVKKVSCACAALCEWVLEVYSAC